MPIDLNIEGLTLSNEPKNLNRQRGRLDLPPDFPSGRYACKWVKKGPAVERAKQKDSITVEGKNYTVDGWAVYMKNGKAHVRVLNDAAWVLMVRPAILQTTLQKLNGNTSRRRMENEIKGQTVAGTETDDTGILTHQVLKRIPGLGEEGMSETPVVFNRLDSEAETTGASAVRVSRNLKIKKK